MTEAVMLTRAYHIGYSEPRAYNQTDQYRSPALYQVRVCISLLLMGVIPAHY